MIRGSFISYLLYLLVCGFTPLYKSGGWGKFSVYEIMSFDIYQETLKANNRIRSMIRETTLDHSHSLTKMGDSQVYMKLENLQYTGSFKLRGAMNKILSLGQEDMNRGVVAASSGNHGAAVAYTLNKLNIPGRVYVPEDASPTKIETIQDYGVEVLVEGSDCVIAEAVARQYSEMHGLTFVSPYNDSLVVAGQGTIAVELQHQLDKIDAVFVSLGGGGLISGLSGYLKKVNPGVKIIGCSPENSPVMISSIRAGEILDIESQPTLSDGTAGGVEEGAITFDLCKRLVDDFILVTEEEIAESMRLFIEKEHLLIEGAAAVAIAGFLKQKSDYRDQKVVIIVCGGNIGLETFKKIL